MSGGGGGSSLNNVLYFRQLLETYSLKTVMDILVTSVDNLRKFIHWTYLKILYSVHCTVYMLPFEQLTGIPMFLQEV